jgi:tetratricopeptide (TPR) repeat protein
LAVEPDNVYALTGLAFCKSNQKNKIEAFQLLQKAYKLDPEDHETNFHLGVHYLDGVKNLNESLKHFEKAQETSDNDLDKTKTLFNIAKVYEENNEHEKAREAYLKVLEINPKDHKAMVNAALISDKLGNRDEAIKLLEQAVSLKATDRRIYTNLGAFHRLKGNFDES